MKERIHIYYTNDLHSDFTYWPRLASYFKRERQKRAAEGLTSLLVDIGDHVDRVDPIAEAFKGRGNVALLNELDYDFVTLGNNEGITFSRTDLYRLYEAANFSVVCSNLRSQLEEQPGWLSHTDFVTTAQGLRLGILGLTVPYQSFYELLGWEVEHPAEALDRYMAYMKENCDIIILLSHLGINEDRQIARDYPEIDLIIGGHTHHLLKQGEYVNQSLITAAGKHCSHVGEVILTWDFEEKALVKKEAYARSVVEMPEDPETLEQVKKLRLAAREELGRPVVFAEKALTVDWFQETEIMRALTDTLRDYTGADFAMLNSGLLLEDFPQGLISYEDVHRICPHPINPAVVYISGDELFQMIRATMTDEFMTFALKGLGFRGEMLGRMVFSGLDLHTRTLPDGSLQLEDLSHKGRAIDRKALYRLATADTFTFGRLLPEISRARRKEYFLPEMIRDLLVRTLKLYP